MFVAVGKVLNRPWLLNEKWARMALPLRRCCLRLRSRWAGVRFHGGEAMKIYHQVRIQGEGTLVLHSSVTLGYPLSGALGEPILFQPREPGARIEIGAGAEIMNGCEFFAYEAIKIGNDCLIGQRTYFIDGDGHDLAPDRRRAPGRVAPIVLERNVWTGAGARILKGVHVGKDAVIAAGAVVTHDVPAGAVMAGNPARQVGTVYA